MGGEVVRLGDVAVHTRVLSLCSGGGGLDIGLRLAVPGARTVCYVENEVTACGVLAARMEDESLDAAPIWTDLRSFDGKPWRGVVDCIIGGYPCQPFSNAGKRLGSDDPRHLWPAIADIIRDVEPRWCFFENVGAHLRLGFREVARDLHGMGYRVAAGVFTAEEVGAPHKRERLYALADRYGTRMEGYEQSGSAALAGQWNWSGEADLRAISDAPFVKGGRWPEPIIRRVDNGLAGGLDLARSDRLRILGNGVVPQQAAYAFNHLWSAVYA